MKDSHSFSIINTEEEEKKSHPQPKHPPPQNTSSPCSAKGDGWLLPPATSHTVKHITSACVLMARSGFSPLSTDAPEPTPLPPALQSLRSAQTRCLGRQLPPTYPLEGKVPEALPPLKTSLGRLVK